ncbi:MAG: LysM peptidoglycan-binding domain-containing protein [Bacteroidales bacterium]|nr:LysM peptidoglycan-binding domain-containing protein [Bacteroidales bacterium]
MKKTKSIALVPLFLVYFCGLYDQVKFYSFMLRKYQLIIFILALVGFNSCQIFNGIGKKSTEVNKIDSIPKQETIALEVNQEAFITEFENDSLDEVSGDSLSIAHQIFDDTSAFARGFENRFSKNDHIDEDLSMLSGSALVRQLDSLTAVKFFNKYEFITDTDQLNIYGYGADEIPVFNDSVYELRIEVLNVQTPIELVYNKHVKAFIRLYAKKGRKQTARMLGLKEIYFPMFEEVLDKYDMPLELKYLAVVESALNPTAGSRAGAKGLWQFMYSTGKMYGLYNNSLVDDRFDPYKATDAAARHLNDLYDIYGSWELALAAYNSGPGNVNRAIRRAGGVKDYWAIWPFLPRETRGYVPAFIAVNYIFSYATEHNIYPVDPGILHYGIDSITVRDVLSFDQIAEFMHMDIDDVDFLNPAYKEGIIPATSSKTYILRLPREKIGYFIDHEDSLYNFTSKKGIEREKLLAQIKKAKERSIHIVRSGENLGLIARKYRTSVSKIKAWNGLRNSRIYPGQKLIVYSPSSGRSKASKSSSTKSVKSTTGYHTVRNGENLGLIAKKYGITVSQLKTWNGLSSNMIKPGQKLKVTAKTPTKEKQTAATAKPNGNYQYHTIKTGDTLWDLAKKYNSTVTKIKQWNGITNSYRLKPGQKLIVGVSS